MDIKELIESQTLTPDEEVQSQEGLTEKEELVAEECEMDDDSDEDIALPDNLPTGFSGKDL